MQIQQHEQQPNNSQNQHRIHWVSLVFVIFFLLFTAIGTTLWVYLGSGAAILFGIIFTAFGIVFAFLQLVPSIFSNRLATSALPQIIIQAPPTQPAHQGYFLPIQLPLTIRTT